MVKQRLEGLGIKDIFLGIHEKFNVYTQYLKDNNIKSIKLSVSAPFHCKLMNNATKIMQNEIQKCDFKNHIFEFHFA